MVSFKTFMKIRYPEWEYEKLSFEPSRPVIEDLKGFKDNRELIDLMTLFYKGSNLADSIRKG